MNQYGLNACTQMLEPEYLHSNAYIRTPRPERLHPTNRFAL